MNIPFKTPQPDFRFAVGKTVILKATGSRGTITARSRCPNCGPVYDLTVGKRVANHLPEDWFVAAELPDAEAGKRAESPGSDIGGFAFEINEDVVWTGDGERYRVAAQIDDGLGGRFYNLEQPGRPGVLKSVPELQIAKALPPFKVARLVVSEDFRETFERILAGVATVNEAAPEDKVSAAESVAQAKVELLKRKLEREAPPRVEAAVPSETRFVLDQPVIVDGDKGVIQAIAEFSGDGVAYRVATPSLEGLTDLQWYAPEAIRAADTGAAG